MHDERLYGCSREELLEVCENAQEPYMGGLTMLAMSILSDAQECIAVGRNDTARQFINRAKFVISQNKSNIGLTN